MNLAEAIAAQVKPAGPKCSVRTLIETLPESDRKVMVEALANPAILASQLARAIETTGTRMLGQTIARHRRGECGCPK